LTGPSEFVVDANGGSLRRGEVVARVTKLGHGFTIETPHGKIVDRGTEFGVVVDDFGVSEVNVFEGRVEAFPGIAGGSKSERIDLTKGRRLQWSGNSIISMNDAQQALRPRLNSAVTHSVKTASTTSLQNWQSVLGTDREKWKFLGEVVFAPEGLRLMGDSGADRPYAVTAHEFELLAGAVLVTCDVQFAGLENASNASFSILTRSTDERGKPATPWHDMLASCVRCSLDADPRTGEGVLEAGAKYEHDREPANLSWRGFVRPKPGETYHLEMRDDGLNVAFTATLADNPSVRKTVACRSLFRGEHNYIAFEGFCGGEVTVSNIHITQDCQAFSHVATAAKQGAAAASDHSSSIGAAQRLLKSLVPPNATLRLKDSFDGPALSMKTWMSLGELAVHDGQLQLGEANAEQHIDTWRQRPYLLTREKFNPTEKAITITGQVTFPENFLHGYGGSFAVLTRANAEYGVGAGWEKSALGRGVRANIWPAALGQNRSVELFEMLSPSNPNLLAAADFAVNPAVRTYLFCVTDNGRTATLTFIDAADSEIRQSLTHLAESPILTDGHLAFEGCWGAPVTLDDVRIYEGVSAENIRAAAGN
jgi:hypothetical protein